LSWPLRSKEQTASGEKNKKRFHKLHIKRANEPRTPIFCAFSFYPTTPDDLKEGWSTSSLMVKLRMPGGAQ
jgi:hypothetical protein